MEIYYNPLTSIHNFYLEWLVEGGLLSFIPLLLFMLGMTRIAFQNLKRSYLAGNKQGKLITTTILSSLIALLVMYVAPHSPGYHLKSETVGLLAFLWAFTSVLQRGSQCGIR